MHSKYLQEQVWRLENELLQTIEDLARLSVQIQLQELQGFQREILCPWILSLVREPPLP